jgi:cathepsin B
MGCNGGILSWAWSYLTKTGITTESCEPYLSGDGSTQACASSCTDGSEFTKYKCVGGSVVEAKGIDQIKAEISSNGPVETGFTVYEDFMNYGSGVYHHTTGKQLGGHAVKIVGYGEDHWICANSWSNGWGEEGFFRIAFGECGINDAAYGCKPEL